MGIMFDWSRNLDTDSHGIINKIDMVTTESYRGVIIKFILIQCSLKPNRGGLKLKKYLYFTVFLLQGWSLVSHNTVFLNESFRNLEGWYISTIYT